MALNTYRKNNFELIMNAFNGAKNIVLIGHVAPDGDTIGSILALKEICKIFEDTNLIDIVISGEIPTVYKFLPGVDKFKRPDNDSLLPQYDLAIAVDVASKDRVGYAEKVFDKAKISMVIDHHGTNPLFSHYNLVDSSASATGELLYEFARFLNIDITKDIATSLYTAILTDTGGFKFSNTTARTFYICSELVKAGADPYTIYQNCYGSKPLKMVQLHSHCLANVNLTDNDRIAWCVITRKLLHDLDAIDEYTDGIVESFRVIDSVEISALFKETIDGNIKVSLRSKDKNVCSVAKEFNGGGHTLAAGCTLKGIDFDKVINIVLPRLQNLLK